MHIECSTRTVVCLMKKAFLIENLHFNALMVFLEKSFFAPAERSFVRTSPTRPIDGRQLNLCRCHLLFRLSDGLLCVMLQRARKS